MNNKNLNEAKNIKTDLALAGQAERCVSVPPPATGLTIKNGKREANVHHVIDGIVYYGVYIAGDDWPAGLYRIPIDEWNKVAEEAAEKGAEIFSAVAH